MTQVIHGNWNKTTVNHGLITHRYTVSIWFYAMALSISYANNIRTSYDIKHNAKLSLHLAQLPMIWAVTRSRHTVIKKRISNARSHFDQFEIFHIYELCSRCEWALFVAEQLSPTIDFYGKLSRKFGNNGVQRRFMWSEKFLSIDDQHFQLMRSPLWIIDNSPLISHRFLYNYLYFRGWKADKN